MPSIHRKAAPHSQSAPRRRPAPYSYSLARTRALDFGYSPGTQDLRAIGAICRHLDGIPLAIEFAAAYAATLGAKQVLARLDDRFGLLRAGRRTALPRHRTLRATLDWSYELLPVSERGLLTHLAVFAGGFTLEAAAVVDERPRGIGCGRC